MLLEYFQMIDRVETVDMTAKTLRARSVVPAQSPVFEGHFPGYPLVPGVLLIETMAQASGFLVLAVTDFAAMPFLMTVDGAKMRSFVEPEAVLDIDVVLEHDGSGFAVTKAKISSAGKRIADAQLKLRTVPFDQVPLAPIVRKRAEEVGLMAALAARGSPELPPELSQE
ncbi:3-hydroxyacyl-[acyl-carrier-protein] dehydratase [Rhizobium sp. PP-F2F-G48]|uniref:3-hydroxyacyl-ACP dehydratase FabZ family protein n=1 Tax=Rhizobium sp. PP-F2F-G48 TaxID=2135651 RepID=UPI0010485D37|nr:3-hydroxyacyl-ACP dehydratase FabZ family protein [Rhizobium sp. PP-F2F-G48]TCM58760.1 3-hydroxyacyl-[acyl-carrier-protein] dehydratase [Rhizobium sp. PP-F2F-G48]